MKIGDEVRFQVADGYAYYKIIRIGKRYSEVTLNNPKDYDDYQEPLLGRRGMIATSKLEELFKREETLRRIFGDKEKKVKA